MILLVLMDRKQSDAELLMELFRLCHSTAGQLHMLGEKNKAVRALVRGFMQREDRHKVRRFLQEYKNDIDEILAASLYERSTDLITVGQALSGQVSELLDASDEELESKSYLHHIVLTLRNQHSFMLTTLMRLAEDVLHWAPTLKQQIELLHKNFPEIVPRPASNTRDPAVAGPRDRLPKSVFMKHGFEDEHIMKHENSTIVVAQCVKKEAPQIIAKENVLMKYVIDTHLDETWEKFMEGLFLHRHPSPNPYPAFISLCRANAMRMDLCFEPESTVLDRMLTKTAKVVDPDNFVYQLPSCEACGPATAVAVLDPGAYVPVLQCVQDFLLNKAYIHRKGPYRIGICLGLTGPSALYGKMRPYLTQLDLDEHYYIQGPVGCQADAAQLFAVMIQKHVWEMVAANKVPIMGVFIGRDKNRWSWEEVINKKLGFFTEVESLVLQKEPIYLKALAVVDGWRYVPVVKRFLLHYMTDDGLGSEKYFEDDPSSFYSTLFSSSERAAFHYQNGGPLRGGNPVSTSNVRAALTAMDQKLLTLREKSDFLEVYRLLLLRSLISDNTDHIVEAWRMFHSIAGQAEYVASLAQSLAELVEFEVEYEKFAAVEVSMSGKGESEVKGSSSPVNLGVVSAMTRALLERAKQVCDWRVSMCALSMPELITHKLKVVVETDRNSSRVYPIMSVSTVPVLEEIQHMFLCIAMTSGSDVHHMCDNGLQTFRDIESSDHTRPTSVDSHALNDPQMFQHRPRAGQKILEDDLLYRPRRQQMFKPQVNFKE
ncbi:uncharacterized protein LOC101862797 [Aplysia californica]|uniref:Uncharacterized protein LOC101862797 n=1 Tax=Aplysia californica TaxID=6500 RepID=A0ABM1A021_APLCA|nr:uncharacterized protein LOC101862797 [Aplysia californica]